MKKQMDIYTSQLCAQSIDECAQKVRDYLASLKLAKKDILRYTMTVEEILLKSSDQMQGTPEIRLSMGRKLMRNSIVIEICGNAYNSYSKDETEAGILGGNLLKNLGLSPEYAYTDGRNRYTFTIKKKRSNPFVSLAVAVASAILLGCLGLLLPISLRASILDGLIVPFNDTFLNLLSCIAGPMVFLAVAWGIYGIGDAATFKNIGKKLCGSYISTLTIVSSAICLLALPLFHPSFSAAENAGSSFSAILNIVLGIVPKDIFSPFINGNTLQIIASAVVVGLAMLFLDQKTDYVAKMIEQFNYIVQFLIEAICKLVPIFIFTILMKLIWNNAISSLSGLGKLCGVFLGAAVLSALLILGFTALKNKTNPLLLLKKGLPPLLIALTTASSAAAFGSAMTTVRQEYGIDEKLCFFGLPLGTVIFKPAHALSFMLQSLFFAEMYSIHISISWIVIMLLSCAILAIASPPIPGGGMATYAVLFAQLGIPMEAVAIALVCDTLFDFVATGANVFSLSLVLLNKANKLGFVDRKKLLK